MNLKVIFALLGILIHGTAVASQELYQAIDSNNINIVRKLLKEGANPNYKTKWGESMLMAAVDTHLHDIKIISLLIEHGADVNYTDKHGKSALYFASYRGFTSVANLLIKNNANVNIGKKDGNNKPIWAAAYKGHFDVVKLLIENGATVNYSKYEPIAWAAKEGHIKIVNYLIEHGADVDKYYSGNTMNFGPLLIWACQENHVKTAFLLLKKNANVNVVDSSKWTPLMHAARRGNIILMEALLARGANIHAKNKLNHTPLILAARAADLESVQYLLSKNATINKNEFSKYIEKSKNLYKIKSSGVYEILYNHINGINIIRKQDNIEEEFIEPDGDGAGMWSPLMNAAHENDWNTVRKLAVMGEISTNLEPDLTVLHHAAMRADEATVLILLKYGADPMIKDSYGKLPYEYSLDNPKLSPAVREKLR